MILASARQRALALVFALSSLGAGCQRGPQDPVRVAEEFNDAVQRRDARALLPMLESSAVERLRVAASQASDQVGGRRSIEPWEMLQLVEVDRLRQVASAELVKPLDPADTIAQVKLTDSRHNSYTVTLVFERDSWHVRIPLP